MHKILEHVLSLQNTGREGLELPVNDADFQGALLCRIVILSPPGHESCQQHPSRTVPCLLASTELWVMAESRGKTSVPRMDVSFFFFPFCTAQDVRHASITVKSDLVAFQKKERKNGAGCLVSHASKLLSSSHI